MGGLAWLCLVRELHHKAWVPFSICLPETHITPNIPVAWCMGGGCTVLTLLLELSQVTKLHISVDGQDCTSLSNSQKKGTAEVSIYCVSAVDR